MFWCQERVQTHGVAHQCRVWFVFGKRAKTVAENGRTSDVDATYRRSPRSAERIYWKSSQEDVASTVAGAHLDKSDSDMFESVGKRIRGRADRAHVVGYVSNAFHSTMNALKAELANKRKAVEAKVSARATKYVRRGDAEPSQAAKEDVEEDEENGRVSVLLACVCAR